MSKSKQYSLEIINNILANGQQTEESLSSIISRLSQESYQLYSDRLQKCGVPLDELTQSQFHLAVAEGNLKWQAVYHNVSTTLKQTPAEFLNDHFFLRCLVDLETYVTDKAKTDVSKAKVLRLFDAVVQKMGWMNVGIVATMNRLTQQHNKAVADTILTYNDTMGEIEDLVVVYASGRLHHRQLDHLVAQSNWLRRNQAEYRTAVSALVGDNHQQFRQDAIAVLEKMLKDIEPIVRAYREAKNAREKKANAPVTAPEPAPQAVGRATREAVAAGALS